MNCEKQNPTSANEYNPNVEDAENIISDSDAGLDTIIDLTLDEIDDFVAAIADIDGRMAELDAIMTDNESHDGNVIIADHNVDIVDGVSNFAAHPIEPMEAVILAAQQEDLSLAYGQLITNRLRIQFGQHWPIAVTCNDINDPTGITVTTVNPLSFHTPAYDANFGWTSLQGIHDALLELRTLYGFVLHFE